MIAGTLATKPIAPATPVSSGVVPVIAYPTVSDAIPIPIAQTLQTKWDARNLIAPPSEVDICIFLVNDRF